MPIGNIFADTKATHILGLLQGNEVFVVPRFQRDYSWKIEHVEALWDDLFENYRESKHGQNLKDSQYLLGPMVITKTDKQEIFYVIDGQQRLATLTMLLCAARNIILEEVRDKNAKKPYDFIKIEELIQNTRGRKFDGWKLVLNDNDKDVFKKIQKYEENVNSQLKRIKKITSKSTSIKLLKKNYVFLHEKLIDSLKTNFDGIYDSKLSTEQNKIIDLDMEMLMNFLIHVIENNFLIKILVERDSTAFQIFETLNERGQSLSKSDLIKNHVIKMVNGEEEKREFSYKWNKIFKEIISNDQHDDDFIIESYRSRYKDTNSLRYRHDESSLSMSKKNLYNIIRNITTNDEECLMFVEELADDIQFLSTLDDPSNYLDINSKNDIMAMKQLKPELIRVPILAAYRKWYLNSKSSDYSRLVRLLVKFFFKTRVIMQQHSGIIERIMYEITGMINSGETLKNIILKLQEYDQHGEFLQNFSEFMVNKPAKITARYTLSKINAYMNEKYVDVQPIENLTLEHILPQGFSGVWDESIFMRGYGKDGKMQDFVARLGNMTLLHGVTNLNAQNDTFDKKLTYYCRSKLNINKKICKLPEWTAMTIEEREKEFEGYADKIWTLD